ncbi:IclR family transcriptional regulator domain-containing protein [Cupriavidus basilensis]
MATCGRTRSKLKYQLGSSALALAPAAQRGVDVLAVVRPYMQELADLSQGVTSLIVRDRAQMLIYENCQSESYLTLRVAVGTRISGLTSAAGRAYLEALPAGEQRQALAAFRHRDGMDAASAEAIVARSRADVQRPGLHHILRRMAARHQLDRRPPSAPAPRCRR